VNPDRDDHCLKLLAGDRGAGARERIDGNPAPPRVERASLDPTVRQGNQGDRSPVEVVELAADGEPCRSTEFGQRPLHAELPPLQSYASGEFGVLVEWTSKPSSLGACRSQQGRGNIMKTIATWLTALMLLAGPVAAHADAVTYDFVGTVINSGGSYSSAAIGSTVTGTYTFNFANENPAQSSGTIGMINDISGWSSQAFGGTEYGNALPTGLVFSTTLSGSGFSYSTPTIGDYGVSSLVQE